MLSGHIQLGPPGERSAFAQVDCLRSTTASHTTSTHLKRARFSSPLPGPEEDDQQPQERVMTEAQKTRVAVNGYGVIGKRVAAAVTLQEDMSLAGVSEVVTDWRARMVTRSGVSAVRRHRRPCGRDARRWCGRGRDTGRLARSGKCGGGLHAQTCGGEERRNLSASGTSSSSFREVKKHKATGHSSWPSRTTPAHWVAMPRASSRVTPLPSYAPSRRQTRRSPRTRSRNAAAAGH